jgi:alkylation response protein AidB-like acyl-CoA dehydrogenase
MTPQRTFEATIDAANAAWQEAMATARKTIDAIPKPFRAHEAVRQLAGSMTAAADAARNAAYACGGGP